jgi:acyl-CoA thioester hydrolase
MYRDRLLLSAKAQTKISIRAEAWPMLVFMAAFVYYRTIEFHETDAAGLVHFSNYFRFAEAAEHALYRSLDYPMMKREDATFYGWPRVRAQAKYSAPLDNGDVIRIELGITEIKDKAIEWEFRILREADGVLASKGSFVTVHVHIDALTRDMKSLPIPAELREKLQPFLASSL